MPDAAVVPDKIAYGAAMSACSKAGERDHTVSLLREMEDRLLRPDITHLTCVLVACALSKDEAAARQAFAELRRRGFEPDAVAYTSLISCFAGADALRKADAVLAEMLAATVHPTVVTYNAVLQVAIREGATDRAQGLAAEMEQRGVPANGETAALLEQLRESPRAYAAHGALAAEASGALPAPWRETVDPSSGRRYYWQDSDPAGTVTWDRPR
ncbi:unnamed protein product [Prorocentrum cordatum]|uniref:WW domain-containing protein n=1 Tax=Prorocentrum cordatum TaxID=2364126 RepID=A0ABN9YDF6_9DINO|nr:unnamed protein product [Polarella glacialis]